MNTKEIDAIQNHIRHDLRCLVETRTWTPFTWIILENIIRLGLVHAQLSEKKSIYAFPSQAYLAKRTKCHRMTVSRILKALTRAGWLITTYRRKVWGRWQTNLYYFGARLWKAIKSVTRRFTSFFRRDTSKYHIGTKIRYTNSLTSKKSSIMGFVEEIIKRIKGTETYKRQQNGPGGILQPKV